MNRGDIFIANEKYRTIKTAKHPIIFWDDHDNDTFIGLMITHGNNSDYSDNIPLNDAKYYDMMDDDFSNTYVVGQLLVKKTEWSNKFEKQIGTLSAEGIELIKNKIINKGNPKWWSEYLKK